MVSSKEAVTNVVTRIEQTCHEDLLSLQSEYEKSTESINYLIESWKRKIIEKGGITNYKKTRMEAVEVEKENSNPNVAAVESQEKTTANGIEKTEESQPDEEPLDVYSLKVVELREELRKRNMDTSGKKAVLQERLNDFIQNQEASKERVEDEVEQQEVKEEEIVEEKNDTNEGDSVPVVQAVNNVKEVVPEPEPAIDDNEVDDPEPDIDDFHSAGEIEDDISMESVNSSNASVVDSIAEENKEQVDVSMKEEEKIESEPVVESEPEPVVEVQMEMLKAKSPKKPTFVKKVKNLFSPSKSKKSPMKQSITKKVSEEQTMPPPPVQSGNSAQTTSMKRSSVVSTASTAASSSEKLSSQPMRDNGSSSSTSVLSSQMKSNGEQPIQTPSIPIKKAGAVFSSSTAQAKMRQQREQREARLKEMRKNLKPKIQAQESAIKSKPISAIKSLKNSTTGNSLEEERKRAKMAAMREKLNTAKTHVALAQSTAPTCPPMPSLNATPAPMEFQKKVRSPMDTYEMSDREESDSGSDSDDNERHSQKKIPQWAHKSNLIPALEKQFLPGPDKMDPDTIFHEVTTCDLEAIFGQRKKRYNARKSTGNWANDQVTTVEKMIYKRKMGFEKK